MVCLLCLFLFPTFLKVISDLGPPSPPNPPNLAIDQCQRGCAALTLGFGQGQLQLSIDFGAVEHKIFAAMAVFNIRYYVEGVYHLQEASVIDAQVVFPAVSIGQLYHLFPS